MTVLRSFHDSRVEEIAILQQIQPHFRKIYY